jgi:dTDP-4-dehydrorhamnose reductase
MIDANSQPTILLTGLAGQVGWELARTLAPLGFLAAYDRTTLDLGDLDAVRATVRAIRPSIIVNAAAYSQVDRAESESAVAQRINADAPVALAQEARRAGAVLVHYSTDYVFDGTASTAYREHDLPAPASAYGRSKLAGEMGILDSGADAYIFRVGWVYGLRGRNFLRTIQRLAAERNELRIVADQQGGPTWCRAVAAATAAALRVIIAARDTDHDPPAPGIYHMAPPDYTTWYEFARAIVAAAGGVRSPPPAVVPIITAEYPTPARRPAWSALDSTRLRRAFGIQLAPWREQLADCLKTEDGERER